ncbi:predicted protein [Thalassiosira pseudonana CCMP1335]|uniref:NECAP PHear domain-containing protein n=1 Tax=Thalassiosira pseudonana TaxID=35128 RepID=B8CDI7_THAPS|nr:predicted protein [Thalassiosira pseudonana CCMP1335]EED88606.1 predicted protein [Thalassiosira pseudonana CCMP1335]|eukprot:scaffold3413_cov181-Alexandrium_tamarense.AAC.5
MLKRAAARTKSSTTDKQLPTTSTAPAQTTSSPSAFHTTTSGTTDPELIERVRLKIPNAHVFKLPPKPSSGGWRGADWRDKVWQGVLKVVERGEETAVLLVDSSEERNIFAVCPIVHNLTGGSGGASGGNAGNGIDRCIDSSRYFVLRIQNAHGRHMFIGLAFNERNDAFDFNTALEDSRREKEAEQKAAMGLSNNVKGVDYRMKEGEKIKVSIPKVVSEDSPREGESGGSSKSGSVAARRREAKKAGFGSGGKSGGFLAPSSKDTPSRIA